jgi:hypothetical protein
MTTIDKTGRITIAYLEKVMKLMQKYQVDELEFDNIKLHKKLHVGPKIPKKPFTLAPATPYKGDEDIMFASSSAPKLSIAEFNRFAANPVKDFASTAKRLKE